MEKTILIILLLLLLLLLPLLTNNNIYEFVCNYQLENSLAADPYQCEDYFLNSFINAGGQQHISVMDEINSNTGDKSEIVTNLIDKLDTFFIIKSGISDTSYCELEVASEKISNLANLIKLTIVSIGSEIEYNQYNNIKYALDSLAIKSYVQSSIITDIRKYLTQVAADPSSSANLAGRIERANTCKDLNHQDDSIYPLCSINGNDYGLKKYDEVIPTDVNISDITR